jgi:colicin import membrane protein
VVRALACPPRHTAPDTQGNACTSLCSDAKTETKANAEAAFDSLRERKEAFGRSRPEACPACQGDTRGHAKTASYTAAETKGDADAEARTKADTRAEADAETYAQTRAHAEADTENCTQTCTHAEACAKTKATAQGQGRSHA